MQETTDLNIEVAQDGSLVLTGRAEAAYRARIERALEESIARDAPEIVVDVGSVTEAGSDVLGVIAVSALRLGREGRRLVVLNCPPELDRMFTEGGFRTLPGLLIVREGSERSRVKPVARKVIWRWLYRDALQHRVAAKCNCMLDAYETVYRLAENRDWNAEQVRATWEERPACPRLEDLSAAD